MTKEKTRSFKISGESLDIVLEISKVTHRNLKNAIEYIIIQGYKKYREDLEFIDSIKNEEKCVSHRKKNNSKYYD